MTHGVSAHVRVPWGAASPAAAIAASPRKSITRAAFTSR